MSILLVKDWDKSLCAFDNEKGRWYSGYGFNQIYNFNWTLIEDCFK